MYIYGSVHIYVYIRICTYAYILFLSLLLFRFGYIVDENGLEKLCESVGNDLRQIFNTLQFMLAGKNRGAALSYHDFLAEIQRGIKDKRVSVYVHTLYIKQTAYPHTPSREKKTQRHLSEEKYDMKRGRRNDTLFVFSTPCVYVCV